MEVTNFICPRCQQRVVRALYSGDFVHDCFGNAALANEDVLIIGNWIDYTGSDVNVNQQTHFAGMQNKLHGTRADLEGEKSYPRTPRGFNKTTHRTRKHQEYIHESKFKKEGIPAVMIEVGD